MGRVTGLWVYQRLGNGPPDPDVVAERAKRHGVRWITAEATLRDDILDRDWLRAMRRATRDRGMRLGVHGYVGKKPRALPAAEAKAIASAIDLADADFAIVNAEIEYEQSPTPDSAAFVDAYRQRKPDFVTYFSSFGRPEFHADLDWAAWADGRFLGMPQAYENLNTTKLKPHLCVRDWARFFPKDSMRPTLGCFTEHGQPRLPLAKLTKSVRDVPDLSFNVYRHGTVTTAELRALSELD